MHGDTTRRMKRWLRLLTTTDSLSAMFAVTLALHAKRPSGVEEKAQLLRGAIAMRMLITYNAFIVLDVSLTWR